MFLPMKVVISEKEIDIVQPNTLSEIPSLNIVTKAISMLYKEEEKNNNNFLYIKFPFGVLDLIGLKELRDYHQHLARMKLKKQCNLWLVQCECISNDLGIDINKIKEYFTSSLLQEQPSLVSITGNKWVTEIDLGKMFRVLNRDYNDTMCLI